MAKKNFFLTAIASLNKSQSLKQIRENVKGITASLQQIIAQAQQQANAKPVEIDVNFSTNKEQLLSDIKLLAQQNSRLFQNSNMTFKYRSLLSSAETADSITELNHLRAQLESFRIELKNTGNTGTTMIGALKSEFSKLQQLFGIKEIIPQFVAHLRNAWAEAKELDKSLTDLSRVNSEMTKSAFPDYLDKVIDKTKLLAVSVKDYIDTVTIFSKAGYGLSDSETLSSKAIQLEKVGGMSAQSASQTLLAGLQGYQEIDGYGTDRLAEKAQALNDKISLIGNTASISQEEVAEGIRTVGSTMDDANTGLDEFLAMLGAGSRTVQDSGQVALALQASALRIHSCTDELQEMGEETDNVMESTAALAEKVRTLTDTDGNGGVNILEADEKTFRSIYDIFHDIAEVYDKMSDQDAGELLDLIAGKNHGSQISAVLQNMEEADALLEQSLHAAGTAGAEYENYLNSAEAASERFGVAMTECYSNILNGETVKGLTNAGAAVLNFANSWGILEGTLRGFLTLNVLKSITTLSVAFKNSATQLSNYGNALDAVKDLNTHAQNTKIYAETMDKLIGSCVNLTDAQLNQVLANRDLSKSQLEEILQLKDQKTEVIDARLAQLGLVQTTETQTAAQNAATTSTFSLSSAMKGLGASIKDAFMANPIGIIITAFSAAISLATSINQKYKQSIEESKRAMQETKQEYQDLVSEVENLNEEIETARKRLEELDAIGYDNLSLVEQEEYDRLKAANKELEREYRIKEALANVKAREVGENARNTLSRRSEVSVKKVEYGAEGVALEVWVDPIELANEYVDLAEKQKQILEEAKQDLAKHEDEFAGTAEDMVKDKKWRDLNEEVKKAERALSDTEKLIGEKYESVEQEAEGLTDSFGNVISGCEDMYQRVDELKNRVDFYFNPAAESEKETADSKPDAPGGDTQNPLTPLTEEKDSLDQFRSSVKSAAEAYTALLSGNYTSDELLSSIQTITEAASNMGASLNWEFIEDSENSLELLGDTLQHISEQYAENMLGDMGIDPDSGLGQMLANIIRNAYETEAALTAVNTQIDSMQDAYSNLTSIVENYNDTGYITFDQLQQLLEMEPEYLACLSSENGQLTLSTDAMTALANQRLNDAEAQAVQQAITELGQLTLQSEKAAVEENAEAFSNSVNSLSAYNAELANTIAESSVGTAVIRDLNAAINGAQAQGTSDDQISTVLNNLETKLQLLNDTRDKLASGALSGIMGGGSGSGAKSAGREAADAYLEAFEDELAELKDMKDRGVITELEYLDRLRELYEQYFRDKEQYLDQYQKYEYEYLQGMKSLYESVFSTIAKQYDKKIDAANEAKDVAVDALEAERDAAKAALQEQIDAIDAQIKYKEQIIDGIRAEIDAIREANEERQREIDLQKAKYELERAKNQRTRLVYKDGQLQYLTDPTEIRDKQEEVRKAETEIEIADKEKQIKLIEKEIDLLEGQKDAIKQQQDALDSYYDTLISDTEHYWDQIISGFEEYKSRYDELADMESDAKAMADLEQLCERMGITVDEVLGMSDEAFRTFRDNYTKTLADIYSDNDRMTAALAEQAGTTADQLGSCLADTANAVADSFSEGFAQAAQDAGAGFLEEWNDQSAEISETTKQSAMNAIDAFAEGQDSHSPSVKYAELAKDAIDGFLLGIEEKKQQFLDALRGLAEDGVSAFAEGFAFDGSSMQASFDFLKRLIESVAEALGSNAEDNAGGLLGAMESLKRTADEVLGSGGEKSADPKDNGSGMIGQFCQLKGAVDDVSAAIGTGDEAGSGSPQNAEAAPGLIGAITDLGQQTETVLTGGKNNDKSGGVIGRFTEFKDVIGEADEHVTSIYKGLTDIDGQEAECTIRVNVEASGDLYALAGGAAGEMKLESASYTAKYSGASAESRSAASAGPALMPLQSGDRAYALQKSVEPLLAKIDTDLNYLSGNAMATYEKQMNELVEHVTNNHAVTNTQNVQPSVNQTFHITMPNVTNATSAETLMKDLQSLATRKYQVSW